MKAAIRTRFVVFANPSYNDIDTPGYGQARGPTGSPRRAQWRARAEDFKNFGWT